MIPTTMAHPATETEISSRWPVRAASADTGAHAPGGAARLALTLGVLGLGVAGCGSSAPVHARSPPQRSAATTASSQPTGFGWLRPTGAPSGWHTARIAIGATMAYPTGWRTSKSDPGTVSEVLESGRGRLVGYLNLTPRTPNERLADWPRFRVAHNGEDNDRQVRALAAGGGLPFATGTGSCVRDSYITTSAARYIEIACLVVGSRSGVVIVAAAPPTEWHQLAPQLERVVESVRA
jgi:hypothetical protein